MIFISISVRTDIIPWNVRGVVMSNRNSTH